MVIKQRTLITICILAAILLVVGGIIAYTVVEKVREERHRKELIESYNRAVEREYKDLVREYDSIIETIRDYDYSYDFRARYVRKLNELLGTVRYSYEYSNFSTVDNCLNNLRYNREEDLALIKQQAHLKAFE